MIYKPIEEFVGVEYGQGYEVKHRAYIVCYGCLVSKLHNKNCKYNLFSNYSCLFKHLTIKNGFLFYCERICA